MLLEWATMKSKTCKKCVNNEYFWGLIGCIGWSILNHSDSYGDKQAFISLPVSLVWLFVNITYPLIQRSFGVWASVNTNRASMIRQHVYMNMNAVLICKTKHYWSSFSFNPLDTSPQHRLWAPVYRPVVQIPWLYIYNIIEYEQYYW